MPFDGVELGHSDARDAIDQMIRFYSERAMSWTSGQVFMGDRLDPSVVCLRGALNFAVFQNAKPPKFRMFDSRQRVWREVNTAMRRVAKQKYHRSSYMHANDHHFSTRYDAIEFLLDTRRQMIH